MSATDRPAPSSSKEASSGSGAASERSPVGASGVSSSIGLWTGSRGSDVVMPGEVGGSNLSQDTPGDHPRPRPASVLVGGLGAPSRVPRPGRSPAGPVCQVPAWGRPLRGPTMGRSVICAGRGVVLVLGPHSPNMLHPLLHPSNLLVRAQIPPLHTYITMTL